MGLLLIGTTFFGAREGGRVKPGHDDDSGLGHDDDSGAGHDDDGRLGHGGWSMPAVADGQDRT